MVGLTLGPGPGPWARSLRLRRARGTPYCEKRCPDGQQETTGCIGGNSSRYCKQGLAGVYCKQCNASGVYYSEDDAECKACGDSASTAVLLVALLLVGLLLLLPFTQKRLVSLCRHSFKEGDALGTGRQGFTRPGAGGDGGMHSATAGGGMHSATAGGGMHSATAGGGMHSATAGGGMHSATAGDGGMHASTASRTGRGSIVDSRAASR